MCNFPPIEYKEETHPPTELEITISFWKAIFSENNQIYLLSLFSECDCGNCPTNSQYKEECLIKLMKKIEHAKINLRLTAFELLIPENGYINEIAVHPFHPFYEKNGGNFKFMSRKMSMFIYEILDLWGYSESFNEVNSINLLNHEYDFILEMSPLSLIMKRLLSLYIYCYRMIPISKKNGFISYILKNIKEDELRKRYESINYLYNQIELFYSRGYSRGDPSKIFISCIDNVINEYKIRRESDRESLI